MPVSASDRRHFDAIAEAKAEERQERMREAAAASPMQKIVEGLDLGAAAPTDAATEEMLDRPALGQAELHRRARRLGLLKY